MVSANDIYNQLQAAVAELNKIDNDVLNLTTLISNGFGALETQGQYADQALSQNAKQNDTIICILEHISQNTCALLNQAVIQTRLQTSMQAELSALAGMFATVNPGAALELERQAALQAQIEKCCPPPQPSVPCTYAPCPAPKPLGDPPVTGQPAGSNVP